MNWYPAYQEYEVVTCTPILANWFITWAIPFAEAEKES